MVEIYETVAYNENGILVDSVYARCVLSGDQSPKIYGTHIGSMRRAAATLCGQCRCGGNSNIFHEVPMGNTEHQHPEKPVICWFKYKKMNGYKLRLQTTKISELKAISSNADVSAVGAG